MKTLTTIVGGILIGVSLLLLRKGIQRDQYIFSLSGGFIASLGVCLILYS